MAVPILHYREEGSKLFLLLQTFSFFFFCAVRCLGSITSIVVVVVILIIFPSLSWTFLSCLAQYRIERDPNGRKHTSPPFLPGASYTFFYKMLPPACLPTTLPA
jgi:hypothetical protein